MSDPLAAVIGHPISHSWSPRIFTYLTMRLGQTNLNYQAFDVEEDLLGSFVDSVRNNHQFIGFNVTVPHKSTVMPLLDRVDPSAKLVGAVNVVHRNGAELIGYNSDLLGIESTLDSHFVNLADKKILILGAGGAARAAVMSCARRGAQEIQVWSPRSEQSRILINELEVNFPETSLVSHSGSFNNQAESELDLVIQATPLGMGSHLTSRHGVPASQFFKKIFESFKLHAKTVAWDLIYNPENTPFLLSAQEKNLKTIGGLEMLAYQALGTWRIWFGDKGIENIELFGKDLLLFLRKPPIFLTGFMGAGKTTVGEILARKLTRNFIDLDRKIEEKAGMKISEIFESQGEPYFRALEEKTLLEIAITPNAVIGLGGGTLSSSKSREVVKKLGTLIYLSASPKELASRLQMSKTIRPLLAKNLNSDGLAQDALDLLHSRESIYLESNFTLFTDNLNPLEVADKIQEIL